MTYHRRSSEEFTSRIQQIVQKLGTERKTANKQDKEGTEVGKLRETENFFNMVKRFFTEHEALRDNAQDCLRDLHQLQRYFQVGLSWNCHYLNGFSNFFFVCFIILTK